MGSIQYSVINNRFSVYLCIVEVTTNTCENKMSRFYKPFFTAVILLTASNAVIAAKPNKLSQLFDYEMLNADVAYFEKIAGVARNTTENKKTYKVEGCEIEADVTGGKISSLKLNINKKCTFDLNKFVSNTSLPANLLTFGKFDSIIGKGGRFYSDCLSMCGNAADPSVYEYWSGSRAASNIEIMLEVTLVDDLSINAADKWQSVMEKTEGHDWIIDTKFNCPNKNEDKYNDAAHKAFKDVKISAITIGYGIEFDVTEITRLSECNTK